MQWQSLLAHKSFNKIKVYFLNSSILFRNDNRSTENHNFFMTRRQNYNILFLIQVKEQLVPNIDNMLFRSR